MAKVLGIGNLGTPGLGGKGFIGQRVAPPSGHTWSMNYTQPGSVTLDAIGDILLYSATRAIAVQFPDMNLLVSTNGGGTWANGTFPVQATGVAGGLGLFSYNGAVTGLAIADSVSGLNKPMFSTDQGATWTIVRPAGMNLSNGPIYYSPSLALFVGFDQTTAEVWTSPDMNVWTSRAIPSVFVWNGGGTDPLEFTAEANGRMVIVGGGGGHNGQVLTSTDGVTWTLITLAAATFGFSSLIWDGSDYVAIGGNATGGIDYSSPDGTTWTQQVQAPNNTTPPFAGPSRFFSGKVVNGFSPTDGLGLSNNHGVSFTPKVIPTALNGANDEFTPAGDPLFVCFGGAPGIASTPDLTTWTDELTTGVNIIRTIRSGFGVTLAGGQQSATSTAAIWKRA